EAAALQKLAQREPGALNPRLDRVDAESITSRYVLRFQPAEVVIAQGVSLFLRERVDGVVQPAAGLGTFRDLLGGGCCLFTGRLCLPSTPVAGTAPLVGGESPRGLP
ncbi:MAG: hypothetical protein ACI8WY_002863, partial [Planctomycetota bacterium]